MQGTRNKGGCSLSSEREQPPLHPPRERDSIAGLQLEGVRRLGSGSALRGGIASLAAIGGARRFGLLLLPAAALPILRRCSLISFCQNANLFGSAYRGERSNAAPVGTCKADNIRSRRKLRKANESQAERQRVVEVGQIVLQQHLAGTRLRSACSSSSPNPAMRGSRGTPLAFLWGIQRGYSLRKENTPFVFRSPAQRRENPPCIMQENPYFSS